MDRCKKLTVLAASLVLGLSGAALAQGTGGMSGSMSGGMASDMSSGTVDYSLLMNRHLDYVDLVQAKSRGLNDNEIATVAKISRETGVSFRDVVDQVLEGQTFASLAEMYNLKLSTVLDVTDEKTMIANYEATYRTTGKWAMKDMGMTGGMMGGSTMGTMGTTDTAGTGMTGGATTPAAPPTN
jgi:hypothetical protein